MNSKTCGICTKPCGNSHCVTEDLTSEPNLVEATVFQVVTKVVGKISSVETFETFTQALTKFGELSLNNAWTRVSLERVITYKSKGCPDS